MDFLNITYKKKIHNELKKTETLFHKHLDGAFWQFVKALSIVMR